MRARTPLPAIPLAEAVAPVGAWVAEAAAGLVAAVIHGGEAVARWAERRRELTALDRLDDHLLRDIGLDRGDVEMMIRHGGRRS